MNKYPFIRKIYLYLFALIGLVLIVIGCVRLVGLALKTYIFTKADVYYEYPMTRPVKIRQLAERQPKAIKQKKSNSPPKKKLRNTKINSKLLTVRGKRLSHWRLSLLVYRYICITGQ